MTETNQVKEILNGVYALDIDDTELQYEVKRFEEHARGANGPSGMEYDLLSNSYEFEDTQDLENQIEEDIKNKLPKVWNELKEIVKQLETLDYGKAEAFINLYCQDEKNEIIDQFKIDFGKLPKEDPLRMETLILLGKLGIIIHEMPDNN